MWLRLLLFKVIYESTYASVRVPCTYLLAGIGMSNLRSTSESEISVASESLVVEFKSS